MVALKFFASNGATFVCWDDIAVALCMIFKAWETGVPKQ